MTDYKMRLVVETGDSEAKALRAYAERERLPIKAAALTLITEAVARRETQERCTHCKGTGWT